MMRLGTALKLARISNLPTIWSNVLAATAITGASLTANTVLIALAISLLYIGGMFLNDAFDSAVDARERPDRPIPSGEASLSTVFAVGFAAIAAGGLIIASFGAIATVAASSLAVAILLYDVFHKGNPVAPLIMGSCRALVYLVTAAALGAHIDQTIVLAALALLAYVAGLTYAAKQETLNELTSFWPLGLLAAPFANAAVNFNGSWIMIAAFLMFAGAVVIALHWLRRREPGDVPRAVSLLIAAIALNDALLAATASDNELAVTCAALFLLTLALHRLIPGT